MKMTYGHYKLSSRFEGNKEAPFALKNYNHHIISITDIYTKKKTSFSFWGSIVNPDIKTEEELLFALQYFLDDARSGDFPFEDFCENLGYDADSIKALKTWKVCQISSKKARRIFSDYITVLESLWAKNL